ncbi:MAG: hypothetical protein ACK55X_12265 [Synechococcaceae cyanobacterium]
MGVSSRPSQAAPRVVWNSWGAGPTPASTTSTESLRRRTFISMPRLRTTAWRGGAAVAAGAGARSWAAAARANAGDTPINAAASSCRDR